MRIVVDTNVIVSAFLWGGLPAQVFVAMRDSQVTLLFTPPLENELRDVLSRPKFAKRLEQLNITVDKIVDDVSKAATYVQPAEVPADAVRDPKDVMVLACAVGGKADTIVTGDLDLLDIGEYEKIAIVSLRHFVEQILKDDHPPNAS